MERKNKTVLIGAAALVLLLAGAALGYNALRNNVSPEMMLAEQPGSVADPQGQASAPDAQPEPEKISAPDFTVEDSDGNTVKLSDFVGMPVVLNFWASWCPPCKAEMPEFDSVCADLGDEVAFMMVNMTDGQRETKEKGAAYISEQGFSFPVYYDVEHEAMNTYGIRSIPTTIFIDSEGYIVTGAEGQINEETLRYGISLIESKNSGEEK